MFLTVRTLILKEWIQTFRDRRMLVIIFVVPVMQMILFGVAVSNDVRNFPIVIVDQDRSSLSREIVSAFQRGGYFRIVAVTASTAAGESALLNNRARMVIVVPPDLTEHQRAGRSAGVQLLLDGSDGNTATIALGYSIRILSELHLVARGASVPGLRPFGGVSVESRIFYNPSLESPYYMVPGIITMILTVIATMLTAMGITKEREKGTFEQLVVSPIRGWELMLGKTIPFAVIAFFDATLATGVGIAIFHIPLTGSASALAVLNLSYVLAMLGLGLFVSTVSESQQQAMMTVFAILFPFIILSDFFFPVENMPVIIQYATLLNPMRFCLRAQREIFLKGSGWGDVWSNIAVLFAFATVFLGYGAVRFRRSLTL